MNRGTKSRSRSEPPVSNPGLDHWLFGKAIHSDASLLTHRNQTGWSEPVIAPFSGKYRDADPYVSQDGKQLYFISDRPGEGKTKPDMDIWVMDVTESGEWGEPRNLGEPINSVGNEWYPKLSATGALYFGSDRPGGYGSTDLYRSAHVEGRFKGPENLGPSINTAADEYEGCIAPDETFIVFMAAGRPDDHGGGDLYISRKTEGQWSPAKGLDERVNGPGMEISPYLSPDGKYFFFSSARKVGDVVPSQRPNRPGNGLGDIYQINVQILQERRK